MTGFFLVSETTVTQQGQGETAEWQGSRALVTLGILSVEEQESLHISLWQSPDGTDWGTKPFAQFGHKFYQGTYQLVALPTLRFIQARWHVNRWGRGDLTPRFRLYIFIEPVEPDGITSKPVAVTAL